MVRQMPRLDAVGLVVEDLARAVAFYRRLGIPFPDGAEHTPYGHAEATLEAGFRLLLDTEAEIRSFDPGWTPAAGDPRAVIALHCASPQEVDEIFQEGLRAGGSEYKAPWDAFWGQRYAQLRDPDGNAVDLYAELKTAESS